MAAKKNMVYFIRVNDHTDKKSGGKKTMELMDKIEAYWTDRAQGYSQVNQE